jgi:hypothetical protein
MEENVGPLKEGCKYAPNLLYKNVKIDLWSYNGNSIWRTRCNSELYTPYNEPDMVTVVRIGTLSWLGYLFRKKELDPCRKLYLLKPEVT